MTTRCQIRFIEKDKKGQAHIAQIYRHADGYLEGVIPDLYKFFKWYMGGSVPRSGDPSYAGADFIYWCKNRIDDEFKEQGYDKLGYGIESVGDVHGDEEYIYEVDMTNAEEPEDVLVRYSTDFPDTHTFEKAKWSKWYKLGNLYKKVNK